MKTLILRGTCAAALCVVMSGLLAQAAHAGPIESACNRSDRKASNRSLCNCIQQVANMTLGKTDQRRAATFFKKPEKAHSAWMSKSRGDDAFWERYKVFGQQAQQYCSPS